MVSPSAFRARQLRYYLLLGPSPSPRLGSSSPPAAWASSSSAGGAGSAQRSGFLTILHVLQGGPHHRAGKRASSSSFSARTSSAPSLQNTPCWGPPSASATELN